MLLMSFTLFNALQIIKLTMMLTTQPGSEEAERSFSACGLFATNRCVVLHKQCVAKAVNVKNARFSSCMQRWF